MSHEAAKREHLKETIQDRSPREESVSRQPTNQLLLLGGRRKKGGKKKSCKDMQMTEGAHRGRWLTRSRRRGRGKEEVGGTGKVGRRVSEETTTFTTSCRGGGGGGGGEKKRSCSLEEKDHTRWMETRAPSLRRLITQPCVGIISHQAAAEGVTWCGSSSV